MKVHVLTLNSVKKSFLEGAVSSPVLLGVSCSFKQGKTYAITGVSGSGKSTLMHIIAGLLKPDSGLVTYDEKNIYSFSHEQRAIFLHKVLGLVFQQPYLIRELTVLENVMLKAMIQGSSDAHSLRKAKMLLEMVGVADKAESFPLTLSGGQQQRVALARALFSKPLFLLADEPTGNLDKDTGKAIVDLIVSYQKKEGLGVIISSHDSYVAKTMQEVWHLDEGVLKKR